MDRSSPLSSNSSQSDLVYNEQASKTPSFSKAFSKLTSDTFHRRKKPVGTVADYIIESPFTQQQESQDQVPENQSADHQSEAAVPNSLPRASFFSTPKTVFSSSPKISTPPSSGGSISRKLSTAVAKTPFLSRFSNITTPVDSRVLSQTQSGKSRRPSVDIPEHKLMAPIHPPLPRSKTFGALPNDTDQPLLSTKTPGYARGTSSSHAKSRGKSPMVATTPVPGYSRRNRPSYAESATSTSSTRKTPFSPTLNTPTSPRVNIATNTTAIGGSESRRPSQGGSRVATPATGNLRHRHSRYSDSGSAFTSASKPTFSSGFKSPLPSGSRPQLS